VSGWVESLATIWAKVLDVWWSPQVAGSGLTLLVVVLVALRARHGPGAWRRLLRPSARTDAAYTAFYVGGFYAFFISGPLYRWLTAFAERHAPFLSLDLISGLPVAAQFLVASVAMDGVLYWTHRLLHASPLLWPFHGIHHSQAELTPLSNFRFHVVDVLVRGLAQFVPGLLLGVPAYVWIPTIWIQVALDGLAHSGLDWSYGPLDAVLVSPRFHAVHHSAEPGHYERNFGMTYSFWDRWFGTAAPAREHPQVFGAPALRVPESFARQLAHPFLFLAGAVGSRRSDGAMDAPRAGSS
jgi:sterol desaturase/sphingolipid hydroxylase (fatty acid hydroxylase superfamily)